MKISKLFHWLYASVMILPLIAIGSTVLVNTFNAEAKNETEIIYKYETNDVNSEEDLIEGNIYTLHINSNEYSLDDFLNLNNTSYFSFKLINSDKILNFADFSFDDIAFSYWLGQNTNFIQLYVNIDYYNLFFYGSTEQYENGDATFTTSFSDLVNTDGQLDTFNIDFIYMFSNSIYTTVNVQGAYITKCENIPIERVEQKEVSNTFYDSLDKVTSSKYFSWAYDSFLVEPFKFIVNLFGMPIESPIVMLLSYWLDISLIWLVFDLIMYAPLLVHKWLDKGAID